MTLPSGCWWSHMDSPACLPTTNPLSKDAATPRPHGPTTCNNRRRRLSMPLDKYNKKKKIEIICLRLHLIPPGVAAEAFICIKMEWEWGWGGSPRAPKERQWPSGSGSDAMQSNGAARKIYKNTEAQAHTEAAQMDTHAAASPQPAAGAGAG